MDNDIIEFEQRLMEESKTLFLKHSFDNENFTEKDKDRYIEVHKKLHEIDVLKSNE